MFAVHVKLLCTLFCTFALTAQAQQRTGNLRINTDLTAPTAEAVIGGDIPVTPSPRNVIAGDVGDGRVAGGGVTVNASTPTNICTREETYLERIHIPAMEPVRVRTSSWCLEFPPRCASYKTEMREVIKYENYNRTRTIRFCCKGYEGNLSNNDTVCKPVCHGGCGRGFCQSPDVCSCETGYIGKHCTQRCDHDRWGIGCKNECQCKNDAACDNKSGICHCTAGWTGQLCESPCPPGTHGVMCRKSCQCDSARICNPQTGACETADSSALAGVLPNMTHVMIQTLNSTIANLTHNLDRIAKNIVNYTPALSTAELQGSSYEVTTANSLPEVILIKQDEPQHTPKIIVHQPGTDLLENIHTASVGKTPEVIHVITNVWPTNATATLEPKLNLAGFVTGVEVTPTSLEGEHSGHSRTSAEHDANLLTTLLIILIIIMIVITASFLYVYRRYHWHKERVEAALAARTNGSCAGINAHAVANSSSSPQNGVPKIEIGSSDPATGGLFKSFLKPLPDLPSITGSVRNKIDGPELYDSPSNNSSIKTPPYAYARKESLYSVITPKSRKCSLDSHLYDEIRYPGAHHHHHHHHQQHQQHQHQHGHHQPAQQHSSQHHVQSANQIQIQGTPQQQPQPSRFDHATTAAAYMPPVTQHQQARNLPPIAAKTVHHVSHLVIPPQNSKFLQVPSLGTIHSRVAHL